MENKELKFEDELLKLEEIVKELESGNVDLDKSISKFNEAMILAKKLDSKLKSTEEQVNLILKDGKLEEFNLKEE
ncbi:MAG: exodeoxyribonuclease VII small subunit [Bacilli bacterium]